MKYSIKSILVDFVRRCWWKIEKEKIRGVFCKGNIWDEMEGWEKVLYEVEGGEVILDRRKRNFK